MGEKKVEISLIPEVIQAAMSKPGITIEEVSEIIGLPLEEVKALCDEARYRPKAVEAFHENKLEVYKYIEATLAQDVLIALKKGYAPHYCNKIVNTMKTVNALVLANQKAGANGSKESPPEGKDFAQACRESMAEEAEE